MIPDVSEDELSRLAYSDIPPFGGVGSEEAMCVIMVRVCRRPKNVGIDQVRLI